MNQFAWTLVLTGTLVALTLVAWLRYPRHPDWRLAWLRFVAPVTAAITLVSGVQLASSGSHAGSHPAPLRDVIFGWFALALLVTSVVWAAHEIALTVIPPRTAHAQPRRRQPRHRDKQKG